MFVSVKFFKYGAPFGMHTQPLLENIHKLFHLQRFKVDLDWYVFLYEVV